MPGVVGRPSKLSGVVGMSSRSVRSSRQALLESRKRSAGAPEVSGVIGSPSRSWEWSACPPGVSGVVGRLSRNVGSAR